MVRPYTEKYEVSFPVAVDAADVFGRAFRLKAIPETFLVDEVGIIRVHGNGPSATLLSQIEEILQEPMTAIRGELSQMPAAATAAELEARIASAPNDWGVRLALARAHAESDRFDDAIRQLEAADRIQPRNSGILFAWGMTLLKQGRKPLALEKLRLARDLDPENWRIRKQIWAVENPEKFYQTESPDYSWQKEQLAREKK